MCENALGPNDIINKAIRVIERDKQRTSWKHINFNFVLAIYIRWNETPTRIVMNK